MSNPDDRTFDYMEEKGCPDFIVKEEGSPFCLHDSHGWCSLSKYFNCIMRENQDLTPKPKKQKKNQDGRSKTTPTPNTNLDNESSHACDPVGRLVVDSIGVPRLSFSAIKTFAQCHCKFYWEYVKRIELKFEGIEKPNIRMLRGTVGHEVLEYIHTADQPEIAGIDNIVDAAQMLLSPSSETPNPSLEIIKPLGWAYLELQRYSSLSGWAEVEWFSEDKSLHGFIDLIQFNDETGNPKIGWEFKFTTKPEVYNRFSLSLQLGTYFLGTTLERITVRVIRIPDLYRRKHETLNAYLERTANDIKRRPEFYFIDTNYWREEFDLETIKKKVRRIQQDISSYHPEGQEAYYQNLMACFSPYDCPYLALCELGVKDYKDNIITAEMYRPKKERGEKNVIQKGDYDKRNEGDWKDLFSLSD